MQQQETQTERRRFMIVSIYGLASLIGIAAGAPAVLYLFIRPKGQKQARWVDAGDIADLPVGMPQEITFRRNRIDGWKIRREKETAWIVRNSDETLTAFSPWCTHLGCAYRWAPMRSQFTCPCHESGFSITGEVLSGPAPRSLDRFEIKIEGKRVWLGSVNKPTAS